MTDRYIIQPGTDWRGDATFTVYDTKNRIGIAQFPRRAIAENFIDSLIARAQETR